VIGTGPAGSVPPGGHVDLVARRNPSAVRVFFGHHRSGSSWIRDIFTAVAREARVRHATVHHPRTFGHDLGRFVRDEGIGCLAYVNAEYRYVAQLGEFTGFHVVRDPRDLSVSAYFSHRYSHVVDEGWPELAERRRALAGLSKDAGLLAEIKALEWEFERLREWRYDDPRIRTIRLEDLITDPYRHFLEIFRALDLLDEGRFSLRKRFAYPVHKLLRIIESRLDGVTIPVGVRRLPVERLLGLVWENDFRTKADGRTAGQEDPHAHYRKGVPGDWRNHFTPEHVAYFKAHYGEVLRTLGYEEGAHWG
jgi:hypothetical protein